MFAVSADFKNAYESGAEQDILLTFADGSTIGKSDISITSGGLTIREYMNSDEDLTIGKASMAELKVTLINKNGKFDNFNFAQRFTLAYGVKVGGAFEYIPMGYWIGERPEKVKSRLIQFTAYDFMKVFDVPAEEFILGLEFPITLGEMYRRLLVFTVTPIADTSLPANSSKTFETNPFDHTDYTCREVMAKIAEAGGGFASIKYRFNAYNMAFCVAEFASVSHTVERAGRFELSISDFPTPTISKLEVYTSYSDMLTTSGIGVNTYVIADNPFLYIENDTEVEGFQPYVDALYDVLSAFPEYYPASVRAVGVPWLECGDIITVIDDKDNELVFPIFAKTMTWNGSWMMELENTGGVVRQILPVEQRELQQLKKKMLKTTDLWTEIDSYLNTEEGVASITSAVGGKFMEKPIEPVYSTPSGVTYGFEKTSDGYYTSTNAGVASSFSYGKFTFNSPEAKTIALRCISYGESDFDYGIISTLNSNLLQNSAADPSNVLYSFYGKSSPDPVDISLDIPAGESFITFKYRKDGGVDNGGDYFKIMVAGGYVTNAEMSTAIKQQVDAFGAQLSLSVSNGSKSSTITLKNGDITLSSQTIQFTGEVVFKSDLSTAGATTINGANIITGTLSADAIDVTDLKVKQVWFNADRLNDTVILTSEEISANNLVVQLGVKEDNGWAQYLELYGTLINLMLPGNTLEDYNRISFDMANEVITPFSRYDSWKLGTQDNSFSEVWAGSFCFDDGSYLYVTSDGRLRFISENGDNAYLT